MKNVKQIMMFGAVLMWFICGSVFAQAQSGQHCELLINTCPEDFADSVIVVPSNVIAISANIRACDVSEVFEEIANTVAPPAIMFVIDHSASMSGTNGHDRRGNRFRVTRALINEIYRESPNAQIGLALFGTGLTIGAERDPNLANFAQLGGTVNTGDNLTGSGTNLNRGAQSYIPLLTLNEPVEPGFARGANPLAIDLFRDMFYIPPDTSQAAGVRQNNTNNNLIAEQNGTNISIAFEAALQAFANAKTPTPTENQYIIFLSDGEPSPHNCGNNANVRCAMQYDFVNGANTPTTYTVFLNRVGTRDQLPIILDTVQIVPWAATMQTPQGGTVSMEESIYRVLGFTQPNTVSGMTYNIQNNGYSATNPSSNIWVLQSRYDEMLELMMENIISPMFTEAKGAPTRMVVRNANAIADSLSSGDFGVDGDFRFTRPLGLNVGDTTTITMGVTYNVDIVTIEDGDTVIVNVPDSLREFSFRVVRSDTRPPSANIGIGNCKAVPSLSLQYGSTGAVDTVKDYMNTLRVVFDQGGNNYSAVTVYVMNTEGTTLDTVTLNLSRSGNIWSGDFSRVVSEIVNREDNILQHAGQDSIIVVFRNPYVPLDTARIAVPYISTYIAFYDSDVVNPTVSTPALKDTINVTAGIATGIYAKFFDADNKWLPDFETNADVSSKITWTTTGPVELLESAGHSAIFRSTAAGDNVYSITATYRDGPQVITKTLYVKVDPIRVALYETSGTGGEPIPEFPNAANFTVAAGQDKAIYARFFDVDDKLITDNAALEFLKSYINWAVDAPAAVSPLTGEDSTIFRSNAAHRNYKVTATLNLPGFNTHTAILIDVVPGDAKSLDIVRDTTRNDNFLNNKSDFDKITLDKDKSSEQVWVVSRDEFGNFVGFIENPEWTFAGGPTVDIKKDGSSFIIEKDKGSGEVIVTVRHGSLDSDNLTITIVGESSAAIGPNPFAPGKSTLGELGGATYAYYKDIIEINHGGSIGQGGQNTSGILMVVEAPMPLKPGANGVTSLRIVIYDAVGNVVLRTNTHRDAKLAESETYGFIWDGKNHRGRTVGPGTYLMRIEGVLWNGQKFRESKKIGIVKAK